MLRVPKVRLGDTGLMISKLGFGTVDFGIAANKISPRQGGRILSRAYDLGISYWDTSDDYGSHPHIASALRLLPRQATVISTKTSERTGKEATRSLKRSLKELGTDYVDIFLMHYVRPDWIEVCRRALKELANEKEAGRVRALGLSTHSVVVTKEASQFEEVDVIMTICCKASQATVSKFKEHLPLEDGSIAEMFRAIKLAHAAGKGVIAMKVLGDGAPPLIKNYAASIRSIARMDSVDAMVVGMKSLEEVEKNVKAIVPYQYKLGNGGELRPIV